MSAWEQLRRVQDEYETALAKRPGYCGSEHMARDEEAGDWLGELLRVVEAAAVYRERQKLGLPAVNSGDLRRARDELDAALEVLSAPGPATQQQKEERGT